MAKRVKDGTVEWGRRRRYPYDEWFDGSVWELAKGEDFDNTASLRSSVLGKARNLGVEVRVVQQGDRVYLQRL